MLTGDITDLLMLRSQIHLTEENDSVSKIKYHQAKTVTNQ